MLIGLMLIGLMLIGLMLICLVLISLMGCYRELLLVKPRIRMIHMITILTTPVTEEMKSRAHHGLWNRRRS